MKKMSTEDERDRRLHERINVLENRLHETEIALTKELSKMNEQIGQLIQMGKNYVTQERFSVVQILVYGFSGIIMTSVIGAVIARVIIK